MASWRIGVRRLERKGRSMGTHEFTHSLPSGNYDVVPWLDASVDEGIKEGDLFLDVVGICICVCL